MAPIVTYVFLDLGTTGIDPAVDEITELCMVAVKRHHLLDTTMLTPRVQHKLVRCYKPDREISYQARSDGSGGFTDAVLQDECSFNMSCFHTIDNFISTLSQPVCLIAHNGKRFDYPILKRYLAKLKVRFSNAIMCADTHQSFYDILEKINKDSVGDATILQDNVGLLGENTLEMQSLNENTPRNKHNGADANSYLRKKRFGALRQYPWGLKENKPEESYALSKVYERVFDRQPRDSHKAEIDCILMLELAVRLGREFVDWIDDEINLLRFPSEIFIQSVTENPAKKQLFPETT